MQEPEHCALERLTLDTAGTAEEKGKDNVRKVVSLSCVCGLDWIFATSVQQSAVKLRLAQMDEAKWGLPGSSKLRQTLSGIAQDHDLSNAPLSPSLTQSVVLAVKEAAALGVKYQLMVSLALFGVLRELCSPEIEPLRPLDFKQACCDYVWPHNVCLLPADHHVWLIRW